MQINIYRWFLRLLLSAAAFALPGQVPAFSQAVASLQRVERIPNSHHPELLYWFLSPDETAPAEYTQQLELLRKSGSFDFVFLTQRNNSNFYDFATMHPIFAAIVKQAHAQGMKVGLQLWTRERDVPMDQLQGLVVETETAFDSAGHAQFKASSRGVRMGATPDKKAEPGRPIYQPVRSEVLRLFAFRKTGDAQYQPHSLVDVTSSAKVISQDPGNIEVAVDAPELAGATLYAMTVHYSRFPDMFSPFMTESFDQALNAYADVGFDGAALDEFRYMTVGRMGTAAFGERFYSPRMAEFFQRSTGTELERTLLEMRYAPAGDDVVRVRAINRYFEVLRQGPLRVERAFYEATRKHLGPNAFHGIHNTFHNALEGDEIWATGINWWTVPRDYGQTDEATPMTTRLGIAMAHPQNVEYNQYYTKDLHRFLSETLDDARYNTRVHYHALHDVQGWGIDIGKPEVIEGIGKVEDKVRLLNAFEEVRPSANVLVLFGFPALLNYDQVGGTRNEWDINANLHPEQKAVEAWQAGYRCVLAPTELFEDGTIRVDADGGMTFGGVRFHSVVMIGPEYSKESTLEALESFLRGGGKLLLDGVARHDFNGNDITTRFSAIAAKAVGTQFSVEAMASLGAAKLALDGGARFVDGSVVLTDLESLLQDKPKEFSIEVSEHTFTGSYEGLLALKAAPDGTIEKIAAGHLSKLQRDGATVLSLDKPSDLVLRRNAEGKLAGYVVGNATVNLK